jgi:hypothetical protein
VAGGRDQREMGKLKAEESEGAGEKNSKLKT